MRDTTVTRVPLKLGLDLQGGMHLALELDQSKQVSADPEARPRPGAHRAAQADRRVRRRPSRWSRRSGDDRIVVELAGITDPARAKAIVQRSAFLEFRITDKTNALEKALPAMDRALREPRRQGRHGRGAGKPSAVRAAPRRRLAPRAGRTGQARPTAGRGGRADSAAADTTPVPAASWPA